MNQQNPMLIKNSKDIIQVLIIIFIDYLYRLFILAPISTIKNYSKHPISMSLLFLFLFPFYLFFKFILILFSFVFTKHQPDTRQDEEEEEEEEDIQKWSERCSICFDAKLDLCLDYCRDQFCLSCFQKYVSEVVKSSWGLCVTKIRCPVCRLHIPQSEWTRYVPKSIIDLYDKFNKPYRSYSRCCPQCETEVTPCLFEPALYYPSRSRLIASSLRELFTQHPLAQVFERSEWKNSNLLEIHHQLMLEIPSKEKAKQISKQIMLLDIRPDTWRKIQFDHISFFPVFDCPTCHLQFCLQCGYEAHPLRTCEEYMKHLVDLKKENHEVLTWALEHSQRCPSCCIMINRDEGCNKVDCAFCGFVFCWECKSAWSDRCGFFDCVNSKKPRPMDSVHNQSVDRAELGVPDISLIESRLFQQ